MKRDAQYYLWLWLRHDVELSLFPEFFEVFSKYTRSVCARWIAENVPDDMLQNAAASEGLPPVQFTRAFRTSLRRFAETRNDRFTILLDFVDIFGGSTVAVPPRASFIAAVTRASVFAAYVNGGRSGLNSVAEAHGISEGVARFMVREMDNAVAAYSPGDNHVEP